MYVYNSNSEDLSYNKQPKYSFSTAGCIALFLVGWLGLKVISYIVQVIYLLALGKDTVIDPNLQSYYPIHAGWINFIIYIVIFLISISIFICLDKAGFIRKIKALKDKNTYLTVLAFIAIYLIANYAYNLIVLIIERLAKITVTSNDNQASLNQIIKVLPAPMFFMVVIFAPIVEELTYRQGLFEAIRRKNEKVAIVVTTLIFALIHFDFSGLITSYSNELLINELINLPSYIIGGLILTLAYNKHRCITESILTHSAINLISYISIVISTFLIK